MAAVKNDTITVTLFTHHAFILRSPHSTPDGLGFGFADNLRSCPPPCPVLNNPMWEFQSSQSTLINYIPKSHKEGWRSRSKEGWKSMAGKSGSSVAEHLPCMQMLPSSVPSNISLQAWEILLPETLENCKPYWAWWTIGLTLYKAASYGSCLINSHGWLAEAFPSNHNKINWALVVQETHCVGPLQ